jgi:hypothetical protein
MTKTEAPLSGVTVRRAGNGKLGQNFDGNHDQLDNV